MTSDGEALLRAVCENPRDDTPRLIYADWLEENGQPERAAFIRFSCEYPNPLLSYPQGRELLERSRQFDDWEVKWGAELPALPGVKWDTVLLERGFTTSVTFSSAKAFTAHADAVFAAAPVQRLCVKQVTARTSAAVIGSPYLRRLTQLILWGRCGAAGGRRFADCPYVSQLEALCLWCGCADDAAEALAACPNFGRLDCLSFSGHALTDRGVTALIDSAHLGSVRRLVLHGTHDLSASVVRRIKKRYDSFH